MQNVIALLSVSRQVRVMNAVNVLDDAIKTGSVFNVELTEAKDAMATALRAVCDLWQNEYLEAYRAGQTGNVEEDVYYWQPVLTNLPGLVKKLSKHTNLPLVAKFLSLTAEFMPYAEALKAKSFEVVKGRKPSTGPVKEIDLSNTGVCAICGRRHKLDKRGKVVDHGFHISDGHGNYFGGRTKGCFGVGFLPFEVSTEANVAFDSALDGWIADESKTLARLERGEVKSFKAKEHQRNEAGRWVEVTVDVTPESDAKKFARLLAAAIQNSESMIRAMKQDKVFNQAKIDAWKPQPLAA